MAGLGEDQPVEEAEPVVDEVIVSERGPRRDQRVRQHGVGIGQPGLRPRPGHVASRSADRGCGGDEERPGVGVSGVCGNDLRGTEGGEGHRAGKRRAAGRPEGEHVAGGVADSGARMVGGGGPECPERPSPPVACARGVFPPPVAAETVVETAVNALGVGQEDQAPLAQRGDSGLGLDRPRDDEQGAGHVIHAIPVPLAGDGTVGMLEHTRVVAQPQEVVEHRCRLVHAVHRSRGTRLTRLTPRRSLVPRRPRGQALRSHRRRRPTTSSVPVARAAAVILSRRGRSPSTRRTADAIACGSRWATRRPTPSPSSSTACGKLVEITGLPAATASISTPDVIWSGES